MFWFQLKDITIEVEARDQGSPAKFRTVNVNIEVVDNREDLPPEWQDAGSTSLDDLVIQVPESEPVKNRLAQVCSSIFLIKVKVYTVDPT